MAYLSRYPFGNHGDNESYLLNGQRLRVSRGLPGAISVRGYDFSLMRTSSQAKVPRPTKRRCDCRRPTGCDASSFPADPTPKSTSSCLGILTTTTIPSRSRRSSVGNSASSTPGPRAQRRQRAEPENSKWFPRDISWTHFHGVEDVYSRIDYIMLSPGMARELDRANSSIPVVPNRGGSDHRPVVISGAKDGERACMRFSFEIASALV